MPRPPRAIARTPGWWASADAVAHYYDEGPQAAPRCWSPGLLVLPAKTTCAIGQDWAWCSACRQHAAPPATPAAPAYPVLALAGSRNRGA